MTYCVILNIIRRTENGKIDKRRSTQKLERTLATKRAMVEKMQKSLYEDCKMSTGEEPVNFSCFYGAWNDADFDMSVDEMNRQIKESRILG